MKLPKPIVNWLIKSVNKTMERSPDFMIGEPENPYMLRWWEIPRNKVFNIYLHQIKRSDDDRALHDHPWPNVSILLKGAYVEHTIAQGGVHHRVKRNTGDIVFRWATKAHRLEVLPNAKDEVVSLFITGPKIREWYFHCIDKGMIWWGDFVKPGQKGQIGKGCGD